MSSRVHPRQTVWAIWCLGVAMLLAGFCWLDTAFAGRSFSESDPFPYEKANSVHFGLLGFRYLFSGHLLSGPHLGYPLVVGALALNTMLSWLAREWGARMLRMFRVSALFLVLTVGLGWPLLQVAEWSHNRLLSQGDALVVQLSPVFFHLERCLQRLPEGACVNVEQLTLPNPTAWGLLGLLLTGLVGMFGGNVLTSRAKSPTWRVGEM